MLVLSAQQVPGATRCRIFVHACQCISSEDTWELTITVASPTRSRVRTIWISLQPWNRSGFDSPGLRPHTSEVVGSVEARAHTSAVLLSRFVASIRSIESHSMPIYRDATEDPVPLPAAEADAEAPSPQIRMDLLCRSGSFITQLQDEGISRRTSRGFSQLWGRGVQ